MLLLLPEIWYLFQQLALLLSMFMPMPMMMVASEGRCPEEGACSQFVCSHGS
jgi:hypothetical protein